MKRPITRGLALGATLPVLALASVVGCGSGGEGGQAQAGVVAGVPATSPVASIQDDRIYQEGTDAAQRVRTMADLGARVLRVDMRWDLIAPTRPGRPRDANDPAYRWEQYDRIVNAAGASGVRILFTVWGTPPWAVDRSVRTTTRFPQTYAIRPRSAAEYGDFAFAAATRYAPKGVRMWEAWNEPNIPLFLRPQFQRRGGSWQPVSPATYSALLKSFYREVKKVDQKAQVAGPVTAPAGDQCPSSCPTSPDGRVTPLRFLQELAKPGLRPPLDVYSHHPYPITRPRDVSFPGASYIDLYNLDRLEQAIDRTYLRGRRLWLTEFGFSTQPVPEYPTAFSKPQQAEFLNDAYRRVRTNRRVTLFTWYFLQDNGGWTSGLLELSGRAKPAAEAFSIPMAPLSTAPARAGQAVRLVGQARIPRGVTTVTVERRAGSGGWSREARVRTGRDGSFALVVRPRATTAYRARWQGETPGGAKVTRVSYPTTVRVR
ncbi:MAG: cellulase family glycosylhydrolase [Thermoleophilia bacterium]|jgi:hypothetical protein|nr:cellulase family glycosylhydrolase [Thermoleophilia bacterium]